MRIILFIAAALLLFPDSGMDVGGFPIYISDLVGLAIFVGAWLFLGKGKPAEPVPAAA
jgi:hypothetical protein